MCCDVVGSFLPSRGPKLKQRKLNFEAQFCRLTHLVVIGG